MLIDEIKNLYDSIQEEFPKGNIEALFDELNYRCQWLARSAELLADAQRELDVRKGIVADKFIGTTESWNIVKHLIAANCADEQKQYTLAERLNSTLTHQIDALRTLISAEKASFKNS